MATTEHMSTDVELVERCRRRDADAFGTLVTRHQGLVFGVALARCQDPALAEDVTQDAFVAAWRDLDRLRDATRVGSWVAGIARNLAANAVRTRTRRERTSAEPTADVPTPEDLALEREDRELLQRALEDIPDTHRETLVLFYLQGQSVANIATALGITEDLVKQRLSRARRAVRDSVAERVESVLNRTRLRPAFGAGVIAALTTAGARKASAGKVIALMSANKIVVGAVVVVVAASAVWLGKRSSASEPTTSTTSSSPTSAPAVNKRDGEQVADRVATSRVRVTVLDKPAERASLLAAIREARSKRAAASPPASSGTAPVADEGVDMDKDYIRSAVREIIPLLQECYEEGLERTQNAGGDVVVEFMIEGEPEIGGVISESTVDAKASTLEDATIRECIQETMYALKLDAPANGGTVKVRYPFAFRPASPDEVPPPKP
jgi:RNA polymerase sigma factor (sigma-70 family)